MTYEELYQSEHAGRLAAEAAWLETQNLVKELTAALTAEREKNRPMTTQCTICQSIHKLPPNEHGARDCFSQRRFPEQYPPNGRKPEITITVDCIQFSHINGGTITFRSKRK